MIRSLLRKYFFYFFITICLFSLCTNSVLSQTIIAQQDFDAGTPTMAYTASGGATKTGSSGTGDRPASSTFYTSNTTSYWVTNQTSTITIDNVTNLSSYLNKYFEFRLAGWSIGRTNRGPDIPDLVTAAVSLDAGTSWSNEVRVTGNSNSYWHYTTGTGLASVTYDGNNTVTTFSPGGGGNRTTDGYSTVRVNLPDNCTQARIRITMNTNSENEAWTIDDIRLMGCIIPANPANPTSNSPQCSGIGVTLTRTGNPPVGETWYWQTSPSGTSTANSGATYNVTTSGTYYIRALSTESGCTSAWSTGVGSVAVTVNPTPIPVGFSGSRCGPGTVALSAATTSGTINWYATSSGGSSIATGTTFTTPSLSASTTYYIDATNGSCTSSPRVPVTAAIINSPTITAGGGGQFCAGSTINLTSSGTYISNQYWTGPDNYYSLLQNPSLTNATVAMTGNYTVRGSALSGINLVANGDFELGNTGFGSSYAYKDPSCTNCGTYGPLSLEATYSVTSDPSTVHINFVNCTDYSASGTKQMIVNGAGTANVSVWNQTVNVVPNTDYQFTYWVQSVVEGAPSELQLYANSVAVGPVYTADLGTCSWRQFTYNWNSGSSTTAYLSLVNQNIATGGNDFALDDIVFQQACVATASVNVAVAVSPSASVTIVSNPSGSICAGTSVTFTATPNYGGTAPSYQWKLNGVNVGTNSPTYTSSTLANGNTVSCVLTSNLSCVPNPKTATSNVITMSVATLPSATISYAGSPFCKTITTTQAVSLTGTAGGTFTASPSGLTLNGTTGAITPSTSTAGTYTVTYTMAAVGGCPAQTATATVTITTLPVATFNYTGTPYCKNASNPSPTFSGGGVAGTFSSTSGLVFVSNLTGQIDLAASTPGTYTVTNTIAASGGCAQVTAMSTLTITALPAATISYSGSPYCSNVGVQSVTHSGTNGGTYSASPAGLIINTGTGAITPGTSAAGTYTVTYTMAAVGGCSAQTATTTVTINQAPASVTVSGGGIYCESTSITASGGAGGTIYYQGTNSGGTSTTNTSTSQTITSSGTYYFRARSAAGCWGPEGSATITINPISTIAFTSGTQNPIVCSGSAITSTVYTFGGSATNATVSGLPSGLNSSVNTTAKTVTISGTPTASGTYTITTSGHTAPCSAATISGTVTVNPISTIVLTSGTQNPIVCSGSAITSTVFTFGGGATNATVSGLPAGLNSTVNTTAKTVTISGIPTASGTYTITTSGHTAPCSAATINGTVTINPISTIALTSGTQNPIVCSGSAIPSTVYAFGGSAVNATVSGLPSGLNSSVNTTAKTVTISGTPTASGTYTITTSGHTVPCSAATISGTVTVNPLPTAVTISGGGTQCGSTTLTASGGLGGTIYFQGTTSGGTSTATPSSSQTVFSSGTYYFRSQSADGCWGPEASATVTINTIPSLVNASGGGTFCGSTTVTALGGAGGTIYFQGTTSGGTSITTPSSSQTVSSSGTYYFRSRSSDGCWGPEGGTTVTINPLPNSVTVSGDGTFCGSTILTASDGAGGTIYFQGTTSGGISTVNTSTSQTITTSGTYYFRSQSAAGCWGPEGSATVTINPVPAAVTVSGDGAFCTSTTISASGGGGETIYFQGTTSGGTSTSTASTSETITTTGTYYFRARSAAGCWGPEGSATVTINTVPTVSAGSSFTKTCVTNPSGAVIGEPDDATATYSWSPSTGLSSPTISNPTANPTSTTTYTVTKTITATGCTAQASVTVTVNTTVPTVSAGSSFTKTCVTNPSGAVIGEPDDATATYSWSPSTGLSSPTVSNPTANPTSTTTYTVTKTITATGCTAQASVTVTVNTVVPTVSAGSSFTKTCVTNPSGAVIGEPDDATATYLWSPSTGLSSPTVSNPTANPTSTTTYTVTKTITATGCTAQASVTVTVDNTTPTLTFTGSTAICVGETTTLSPGSDGIWISDNPLVATISNEGLVMGVSSGSTTFTFTQTSNGCSNTTSALTVNTLPTASIAGSTTICNGTSTNLTVTLTGNGPWNLTYTDGITPVNVTGQATSPFTVSVSPNTTKTYSVTSITDTNCTGTNLGSSATITVDQATSAGTASASPAQVCLNSGTTLTLAGSVGAIQWQTNASGSWQDISGATSATYNTPDLIVATSYRARVTNGVCGTVESNSVEVTVDSEKPVLVNCPTGTLTFDPGSLCSASINTTTWNQSPAVSANDNCDSAPVIQFTRSDGQTGSTFPIGSTTVTLTATDNNGNVSASCTFTVLVREAIPPTITCPAGETIFCAANLPAPYANFTAFQAAGGSASDNAASGCGLSEGTFSLLSEVTSGSTITRTYQISDYSGNTATCTQVFTVISLPAVTITSPGLDIVCAGGGFNIEISSINYTGTKHYQWEYKAYNGSSWSVVGGDNPTYSGTLANLGDQYRLLVSQSTDFSNVACTSISNELKFRDVTNPVFVIGNAPTNQTICVANGATSASVTNISLVYNDVTDNCTEFANLGISYTINGGTSVNGNMAEGTSFNLGTSTVVYIVTDQSGNSQTHSFTITVNQNPALSNITPDATGLMPNQGSTHVYSVTAEAGYTYIWSVEKETSGTYNPVSPSISGQGTASASITWGAGTMPGNYRITVIKDNNLTHCQATATLNVTVVNVFNPKMDNFGDACHDVSGTTTIIWRVKTEPNSVVAPSWMFKWKIFLNGSLLQDHSAFETVTTSASDYMDISYPVAVGDGSEKNYRFEIYDVTDSLGNPETILTDDTDDVKIFTKPSIQF